MKQFLKYFYERLKFEKEHADIFIAAYDILSQNEEFVTLVERFYIDTDLPLSTIDERLAAIIEPTELHLYTGKFVFYSCLAKELPIHYEKAGISEDIMWDTLEDLRYKLYECLDVKGVPGFFACGWFMGIFKLRLFKLGRLEFNLTTYSKADIRLGEYTVNQGETVIDIHIPSSGEPFDKAARYDAYSRAYRFFRDVRHADVKAFVCNSWLLYPDHYQMLKPTSNIVSFMDDFKIYASHNYENKRDSLWRFFGHHAEKPFEELPRTNSLWKAYAERLCTGGDVGSGSGIFVWDDVNKVTVK